MNAPWRAYLALGASMAIVGGYVGSSKLLVAVFPVFLLAWLRFGIAAVAMAGWLRRDADEPTQTPRVRRLLFLGSFFGNFLFSVCMLFGMSLTSAVSAGVIMASLPAVVAVLAWVSLHERPSLRVAAAIGCAVGGIALVSLTRTAGAASASSWLGDLLLVGAVLCEAIYVVIGKRLVGSAGPKRISAVINLWGLALVTPFGIWQASSFDFGSVAAVSWLLLLGYSIAASLLTVWLWMTGLEHVPASSAGVCTVLLPISAAGVGVLFLGERFSASQLAAFGLALTGVLLATWPGGRMESGNSERASPS